MKLKRNVERAKKNAPFNIQVVKVFVEQLKHDFRVIHLEYDDPELFPDDGDDLEGTSNNVADAARQRLHEAMSEIGTYMHSCLECVNHVLQAAYDCLKIEHKMRERRPPNAFLETSESPDKDGNCSGGRAGGEGA